jgi:hypothetical protein
MQENSSRDGIDAHGNWTPTTCPKREELRWACRNYRYVAANGRRYTGKTISALHCLVEHCWETHPGNACILTISQTVGMDSGVWQDLVKMVIPEWISGNFGLEWAHEPGINGVTKKPYCSITNRHGTETQIALESLQVEDEVEDRFKPRRYSMIYIPELTTFTKRQTFDTLTECLRMIGLPEDKHLLLVDYNPPDDTCWWIHDLWWDLLGADEAAIDPVGYGFDAGDPDALPALLALKRNLFRLDFFLEDNPWADPQHVALLKAKYAHNPDLYRRYILGEPARTTEHSLFADTFRQAIHVVGDIPTASNKDPDALLPLDTCTELITGWDPGDSVNSAAVIAEKVSRVIDVVKQPDGTEDPVRAPVIKFLDEHVITGEPHRLEDFVYDFMVKMLRWEKHLGRVGEIKWRHWSDRSVFERFEQKSLTYLADIVLQTSMLWVKRGEFPKSMVIYLVAADRNPGSLGPGIDLWRRMLFETRLYFSAPNCPKLIEANKSLRKPKTGTKLIQAGCVGKHPFDAARYLVTSEAWDELARDVMMEMKRGKRRNGGDGGMVNILY